MQTLGDPMHFVFLVQLTELREYFKSSVLFMQVKKI